VRSSTTLTKPAGPALNEQLGFPDVSAVARKKKSLAAMKASSSGLNVK
jgi:hypothetical protein